MGSYSIVVFVIVFIILYSSEIDSLEFDGAEFMNSVFKALLASTLTLFVWFFQERYKSLSQKRKLYLIALTVHSNLSKAFLENLSPFEQSKIRQEILSTNIKNDISTLKDVCLTLMSIKVVEEVLLNNIIRIENILNSNENFANCKVHVEFLLQQLN